MAAAPMPIMAGLQHRFAAYLGAVSPFDAFGRLCGVILVLFLVRNVAEYSAQYLTVSVEQAAMRDLRRAILNRLRLHQIARDLLADKFIEG